MAEKQSKGPLLLRLKHIEDRCEKGPMTFQEIFEIFGPQGHHLFLLFLILPFLQPLPLLGLSTPFGFLIGLIGLFAYLRKLPLIPKFIANKYIPVNICLKITKGVEYVFNKISFLIHPRMNFLFNEPFRSLNYFLFLIAAILLILPVPIPLSNAFPAWLILFQTIARLERDGFFMLLSYVQAILCTIYFSGIVIGIAAAL